MRPDGECDRTNAVRPSFGYMSEGRIKRLETESKNGVCLWGGITEGWTSLPSTKTPHYGNLTSRPLPILITLPNPEIPHIRMGL